MDDKQKEIFERLDRGEITPEMAAQLLGGAVEPECACEAACGDAGECCKTSDTSDDDQRTIEELLATVQGLETYVAGLDGETGDVSSRLEELKSHIEAFRAKVARMRESRTDSS